MRIEVQDYGIVENANDNRQPRPLTPRAKRQPKREPGQWRDILWVISPLIVAFIFSVLA